VSAISLPVWYWAAAGAYLLLFGFVLISGGRGLLRSHFLLLAAVGAAWGAYWAVVSIPVPLTTLDPPAFGADLAFLAAWFLLLFRLLRGPYLQSMPETVRTVLSLFWLLMAGASMLAVWYWYAREPAPWVSAVMSAIAMSAALVCLALAAQLSRDSPVEDRRALRSLVLAAGAGTGSQGFLLGVATLAGELPVLGHAAIAGLAAGSAAMLGLAVRQRPQWSLAIFVSPQAWAYAPRLLAMLAILGGTLAMMPVFRAMEPPLTHLLAILLMASVLVPMAAVMFSQQLSARIRVFVSKHFLPFRYDYREEWLRLIDTLAAPEQPLPLPERVIKAVAQIVGSPGGLLWMRRAQDGAFVCTASWNTKMLPDVEVRPDDPIITFMFQRQWIFDTAELTRNPAMYNGLSRPAWLERFPEALLLVPLISNEALIGFMLLQQSSSAFRLTFEEIDLLRTSGRQVAAHLAQYEADQRLAEAKQFEAFNRLTAFVMHDLKNLIAQQSLVVKNAARHKANPAFFEDAIATIENSVARMNKLLQQLQSGEATGRRSRVRLAAALQDAVERCRGRTPEPRMVGFDDHLHASIDRERFATVTAHLVRNAQDATSREGRVEIRLAREGDEAVIVIEDDGCGMDAEFIRTRLFRPFDSTKGSKGMGIGAYQAKMFVTDCGGTLHVESDPGRGTCITIRLPLAEPMELGSTA
jgi:putative PEP-CTERM system histidine kinase